MIGVLSLLWVATASPAASGSAGGIDMELAPAVAAEPSCAFVGKRAASAATAARGPRTAPRPSCRARAVVKVMADTVRPHFGSGIFAVYTSVKGRDRRQRRQVFYLIYFGVGQSLPQKGDTCRICYHRGALNGIRGEPEELPPRGNLVDDISCR